MVIEMAKRIEWIVKASKLCNLRCRYCYEWEELSNTDRMGLELWEKVLLAIRDYRLMHEAIYDESLHSGIIWHGGEPMIQPISYWQQIMALQEKIFPAEWLVDGTISNSVQTNLYSVSDKQIDFFREYNIKVGVSCDFVPGARLSVGGKETEVNVLENLQRLEEAGIPFGIITVLAAHTRPVLKSIHDNFMSRESGFRILPLYKGPDSRPIEGLGFSNDEIVEALKDIFVHWFESGCAYDVAPLSDYLWVTVMKMLEMEGETFKRSDIDELAMIVNTDGKLHEAGYRFGDEDKYYGDLSRQTLQEVFDSKRYKESVTSFKIDQKRICSDCSYLGFCNTFPAFAVPDGGRDKGRCQWAKPMMQFIENYLIENKIDDDTLRLFAYELQEEGELY